MKPLGSVLPHSIPQLETRRLLIRAHLATDLDPAARMWADSEVTRFIGGKPRSRSEVWTTIQRNIGSWWLLGYGFWAITDRSDGRFLGEIGFLEGLRDLSPGHEGTPEMGWCLAPSAWGSGIASEAVAVALDWFDRTLGTKCVCIIEPDNKASVRVAERNGFAWDYDATGPSGSIGVFRRPALAQ
ncbi:GNAT family N-acetyltransferase [Erythrobacter aureus]|uniref:GNAT family N-acetyltransferase n=1 Tax=Erythrobacter aureus TaxID=2182384 RepID=UPI0018F87625|nr:GNAT family N-acetyltransferase [Erythrobacter aureus]